MCVTLNPLLDKQVLGNDLKCKGAQNCQVRALPSRPLKPTGCECDDKTLLWCSEYTCTRRLIHYRLIPFQKRSFRDAQLALATGRPA